MPHTKNEVKQSDRRSLIFNMLWPDVIDQRGADDPLLEGIDPTDMDTVSDWMSESDELYDMSTYFRGLTNEHFARSLVRWHELRMDADEYILARFALGLALLSWDAPEDALDTALKVLERLRDTVSDNESEVCEHYNGNLYGREIMNDQVVQIEHSKRENRINDVLITIDTRRQDVMRKCRESLQNIKPSAEIREIDAHVGEYRHGRGEYSRIVADYNFLLRYGHAEDSVTWTVKGLREEEYSLRDEIDALLPARTVSDCHHVIALDARIERLTRLLAIITMYS